MKTPLRTMCPDDGVGEGGGGFTVHGAKMTTGESCA